MERPRYTRPGARGARWIVGLAPGLALALLYLLVASIVLDAFMTQWGAELALHFAPPFAAEQYRPFAYRVATPFTVWTLAGLLPAPIKDAALSIHDPSGRPMVELAMARYGWDAGHPFEFLVLNAVLLGCVFLLAWTWRYLLARPAGLPQSFADAIPALALLVIPLSFVRGGYAYDLPELLLSAVCFTCFVERRYGLYYLAFAVAMLNKESSILLFSWMASQWFPLRRAHLRPALLHGLAHAAIGGGILAALYAAFADHPGMLAAYFLPSNLEFWFSFSWLLSVQDAYATGVPLPAALNAVNLVLLAVLLRYGWPGAGDRIRRALLGGLLTAIPLLLTFGYRDEVRVLGPSFTPLMVVCACAVARFYGAAEYAGRSGA